MSGNLLEGDASASEAGRFLDILKTEVGSLQTHSWQFGVFATRVRSASRSRRVYENSGLRTPNCRLPTLVEFAVLSPLR